MGRSVKSQIVNLIAGIEPFEARIDILKGRYFENVLHHKKNSHVWRVMKFRHACLRNPFLDKLSGVEASLKSFVNGIHNKYHLFGLHFDQNFEPSEKFQSKIQFLKKTILVHFFEGDLKILEDRSSAKVFRTLCKEELSRGNPYNGVHICDVLSENLKPSERNIIFRTLCGIFFKNKHVCPVLRLCYGQKCTLCKKKTAQAYNIFCTTAKP